MTSYRNPRNGGATDSDSPEYLEAPVCSSSESSRDEDANSLPPKSANPREFLGRSSLRLLWLPAALDSHKGS